MRDQRISPVTLAGLFRARVEFRPMLILAQVAPRSFYDFMVPIPGGEGASVHVVVLAAGLGCLACSIALLAVLLVILGSGRRGEPD